MTPLYTCKECGLAVLMLPNDKIVRPCGHTGTILANGSATLRGVGGLAQQSAVPQVDWRAHDKYPESTCTCVCGTAFRSHAKAFMFQPPFEILARKACPSCGGRALSRAASDHEAMTLGRPSETYTEIVEVSK